MQVEKLLNVQKPWILIDKLMSYVPDKEILTKKHISSSDYFLIGHFPNYSVYPGMLMLEGLRQSAELLKLLSTDFKNCEQSGHAVQKDLSHFAIKECETRLLLPAKPGHTIEYTIKMERLLEGSYKYNGQGSINGQIVIKAKWQEVKDFGREICRD